MRSSVGEEGGVMKQTIWLMIFGMAFLLTGCSNVVAPTATLETSATEVIPTQITSTPSMTKSFTPEPSLTSTQTLPQTQEPLSTESIGVCRLPCWWGITPGATTWEETLTKLKNKKSQMIETEEHYNATESKLPNELGYVWVYRREDGKVNWIDISSKTLGGIQYYDLLTDYGEPSEIYIFTYKDFQTRPPWLGKGERPANVFFYYAGKGILAEYEFFGKLNETTNLITICPTPTSQELWLDPVGTEYEQKVISQIALGDGPTIQRIDEATSLTKHDFYLLYKDKIQIGCFETPASLWP
jgi:hypothetical protein